MSKPVAEMAAPAIPAASIAATAAAPPEMFARDALIAWYRGEFAAANAIIDSLFTHIVQTSGGGSAYEAAFAAIQRRRMNWRPVIQLQRFYPIADVQKELQLVAAARMAELENSQDFYPREPTVLQMRTPPAAAEAEPPKEVDEEESARVSVEGDGEDSSGGDSDRKAHPDEINGASSDRESHEEQSFPTESAKICLNHEECASRPNKIKACKGFMAREPVKGHMVNIVKGLKVYEDIFTELELLKLSEYINELRLAGHRGDLSGETFIFFNKQMKGNKREIIQLGVPLFQPTSDDLTSNIEPIPPVLEAVIEHLIQWRLIPEGRRPNSCIINFFDEHEFSQPYFKPPHIDNPISTLVLSDTGMAFGRLLVSDTNGNYKGSLTLPLKEGSLVVMRGNSAEMARHVICPSNNRRVSITFVRVRPASSHFEPSLSPTQATAMTLWQPAAAALHAQKLQHGGPIVYGPPQGIVPSWGLSLRASPFLMLPPCRPMAVGPGRRHGQGGTGVFLPWTVGPKKYTRHLPPRIQKRRLPSLPSPIEAL